MTKQALDKMCELDFASKVKANISASIAGYIDEES